MMTSIRQRAGNGAVLAVILAASVALTWHWGALGDYPDDGGPPISDFLHGQLGAFFHQRPSMGSLAIFLRLPFAALAFLGSPTPLHVYLYGCVPCVVSVGLLGWWLARIAASRGTGIAGQAMIVALSIANPLVRDALALGHPEELLTASLAVGALVAAWRRRELPAAILLGLALASKQWSVVVILPVLLVTVRGRRTLGIALTLAAAVSLPLAVGSPQTFLDTQLGLVHQQFLGPASDTWLYPLASSVAVHIVVDGHRAVVSVARLPAALVGLLHPLIIALAAGLAAALWRRTRGRPSSDEAFALVAVIFLLRCTLDTETMPYYHAALMLTLLAWDSLDGRRVPVRALAACGLAYLLCDRLPAVASPTTVSACYGLVTLVGAGLLLRVLARGRPRPRSSALAPPARAEPVAA